MMTEDVNAAVRGALTAGATSVTVNDAHGPMRNLLPDSLHPAARLIRGKPKNMTMLEGLDATYDAVLCIGFHSRAGTLGVLSHSLMGHEIEDMWLDDRPVGEIGLAHATAAALGVPVVMLSGDDTACAEMTAWDPTVPCVAVKKAGNRFSAVLSPVGEARQAIEKAVVDRLTATTAATAARVPSPGTSTLTVRWQSASVASTLLGIPGVTSSDSSTVQAGGNLPDLYRLFGVWMRVATALTNQAPYC
ncbi:M55 family metallopeptidase [Streptomyces sp. NPDC059786]|uniref:M55 family metallopeptidase n=1 Tax=Streptomyces sp. NPDC059786 TaxID=3346946 RepID=UPI003669EE65